METGRREIDLGLPPVIGGVFHAHPGQAAHRAHLAAPTGCGRA